MDYVKWGMSWHNLLLYLAVIPGYSEDEGGTTEGKEKVEVKDIWDVF